MKSIVALWKKVPWYAWASAGGIVLLFGGMPLFVAWLLPGVPPPGPFG